MPTFTFIDVMKRVNSCHEKDISNNFIKAGVNSDHQYILKGNVTDEKSGKQKYTYPFK